jgi:proline iminopeptidase
MGARRTGRAARTPEARRELKSAWQALRPGLLRARLQRPGSLPARKIQPLWQKFRLQSHHLAHHCGLRPGQWQQALRSIADAGIATTWIHGRFDAVCPPGNSLASHQLLAGQGVRSRLVLTAAGHLGTEPGNHRALLAALREGLPRD